MRHMQPLSILAKWPWKLLASGTINLCAYQMPPATQRRDARITTALRSWGCIGVLTKREVSDAI